LARPVAEDLTALEQLDRAMLHVFVAGPGTGEGIAVALPSPELGWVLIDGCRCQPDARAEDLLLRWVLSRFRQQDADDPIRAMVLTHPHADHADGFGELIVKLNPHEVAIASTDPPSRTLADLYAGVVDASPWDAESDRRRRQVAAAFKAMRRWEDLQGRPVISLHDDRYLTFGSVQIKTRAPTVDQLTDLLGSADADTVGSIANRMSLVLEVTFGDLRVLLGGDMPADVVEGWPSILERHPNLAGPLGFKIPHHGSRQALHEPLLGTDEPRCWWVTPFARSALPRGQHDEASDIVEGMAILLGLQESVQVTALPTSRARQRHVPPPGYVTQTQWNEAFQAKDLAGPLAHHAVEVGPPPGARPAEPIWVGAFDNAGTWIGRWRGAVAMEVVRDAR